jgi:uncharacterized membrane protein YeiB
MTRASNDPRLLEEAIPPRDRIDAIDLLRGLALFGVLAVNLLTEFRVSIFQQFLSNDTPTKGLDGLAETFVSFALESKAFSLFSILFGVGLAIAVGYGAVVISAAQIPRAQRLLAPFAAVGRMAFTNYILQSVIFGFIFFGYGLGLFGHVGAALALLLGIAVYGLQAILSTIWLRQFRFGPLEWLWRTLMYGRMQPMKQPTHCGWNRISGPAQARATTH